MSFVCQRHAVRMALKQLRLELILETLDGGAHGGLRHVEVCGRDRDFSCAGGGNEVTDLTKRDHSFFDIFLLIILFYDSTPNLH